MHNLSLASKVSGNMKFAEYFNSLTGSEKKDVADRADTSVIYLYHLASGKKRPSLAMAEKLQRATRDAVRLQDWQEARA